MILSDLRSFQEEAYVYPEAIRRAIESVIEQRMGEKEPGKYELQGKDMFVLVQDVRTRPSCEQRPEAHRVYTDIQIVIEGKEQIGYRRPSSDAQIVLDELDDKDIAFYGELADESALILTPGSFVIFFPGELHRPCCSVGEEGRVKKLVIKIHRSLLSS